MSDLEYCVECDQPTGRAGLGEDSLYPGGEGPYCENCFEEWPDKKVEQIADLRQQLTTAQAEIEALRGRVAMMEGAIRATVKAAPAGGPLWFQSDEINALADSVKDSSQAWLKRKQAEAVERTVGWLEAETSLSDSPASNAVLRTFIRFRDYAQRLRQQADEAEKAGGGE